MAGTPDYKAIVEEIHSGFEFNERVMGILEAHGYKPEVKEPMEDNPWHTVIAQWPGWVPFIRHAPDAWHTSSQPDKTYTWEELVANFRLKGNPVRILYPVNPE